MGNMQFHEDRLTGLGGSDIGAVLGLNPWKSPYQVYQEKIGAAEPFTGNLQTRFGSYAEEFVAREYTAMTGRAVQRFNAMLRHPTAPIIGHVDRLVIPEGAKRASWRDQVKTDRGLEAKTASAFATGRDSDWGEDGTDQVPESYLVQVAAYQALTGCEYWDLAVIFGNQEFRIYHLTRDLELEGLILEAAEKFWRDHVLARIPPAPRDEAEARQRWQRHQPGKIKTVSPDLEVAIKAYAAEKARLSECEKTCQRLRDAIIPALEDSDLIQTDSGLPLATYRANKDSQRTDWQRMSARLLKVHDQETQASVMAEFTKTTPGARVLRLAKELEINA